MKENINEHDMTKKMMEIIRGGFKTKIIKEADESQTNLVQQPMQSQLTPGDDLPEKTSKPPKLGNAPKDVNMDSSYFELDRDDERFKRLEDEIKNIIGGTLTITSIYINKPTSETSFKDLIIVGKALNYGEDESGNEKGLFFTLALSEDKVKSDAVSLEGTDFTTLVDKLQKYLNKLKNDPKIDEYLYDKKIDGDKQI